MTADPKDEELERLRARAGTLVYERLALLTAVIWSVGTFILMATIVPYIEHPQVYIFIASTIPIIPAALPWLFYRPLTASVVRRWSEKARTGQVGSGPPPDIPVAR